MAFTFDIIEYIGGITNYTFDKAVLNRIALDRGVMGVTNYDELSAESKELLKADLLYTVYSGANSSASYSLQDGDFKESIGSQTVNDMKRIYNIFSSIYGKYDPEKLEEVASVGGQLEWVDESSDYY